MTNLYDKSEVNSFRSNAGIFTPPNGSGPACSFSYSYLNASSKVSTISLNGQEIVRNSYDSLGRLIKKENFKPDGTLVSSYEYTLNNSDERIGVNISRAALQPANPENFSIAYSYDFAGQLISAIRKFTDGFTDYSYNYSYTYDPAGNPLNRTTQGQSRSYTFNNLNQFLSVSGPDSTDVTGTVRPMNVEPVVTVNGQQAAIDANGNWVANVPLVQGQNTITTEVRDKFNRRASGTRTITLLPPPVFSYDVNGNMTDDGLWQYTWNEENMLGSVCSVSSVVKVENSYDGFGRRRIKKVYQLITDNWSLITEIHLIYDGAYIIAETDGSGNVLRRYIRNRDQLLAAEDISIGKTFYYFTDGNKNVTDLIDSDGVLAAHYEYDPFGRITAKSGYYADTNPFRFSSEYFDKETGLVAYLYRFYSPEYCRFLSRDPIQEAGGINLYPMCFNNPVNFWDLLGLDLCNDLRNEDRQLARQISNLNSGPLLHAFRGSAFKNEKDLAKWIDETNTVLSSPITAYEIAETILKTERLAPIPFGKYRLPITSPGTRGNIVDPKIAKTISKVSTALVIVGAVTDTYSGTTALIEGDYMEATSSGSNVVGGVAGLFVPPIGIATGIGGLTKLGIEKGQDVYLTRKVREKNRALLSEYMKLKRKLEERQADIKKKIKDCCR